MVLPGNAKDYSMFHKVKTSSKINDAQSCFHDRKTKPTVASETLPEGLTDRIKATAFGQAEVTSVLPYHKRANAHFGTSHLAG